MKTDIIRTIILPSLPSLL